MKARPTTTISAKAYINARGPGIATDCGLNGPGIESRWVEIFRRPDRPWDPPSLLYNGYRVFLGGRKRPGRDADPSPFLVPRSKNRVELYLYCPYGPSWPIKNGETYLLIHTSSTWCGRKEMRLNFMFKPCIDMTSLNNKQLMHSQFNIY